MTRACRWCEREFTLVNEYRWLCDECNTWNRKQLPGIKRLSRAFNTRNPRHFEAQHQALAREERALELQVKAESRLARRVDAIHAIHKAILTGHAGSWYHGKTPAELKKLARS